MLIKPKKDFSKKVNYEAQKMQSLMAKQIVATNSNLIAGHSNGLDPVLRCLES